jgi:uncharacterized protein YjbI with pentapeptide repeats
LRGASLSGAKLTNVKLSGANLSRADLRGAKFEFVDLRGADFRDALFDESTTFDFIDLTDVVF